MFRYRLNSTNPIDPNGMEAVLCLDGDKPIAGRIYPLDVWFEVIKLNDSDPDCSPEDIEAGRDSYFKKASAKSE